MDLSRWFARFHADTGETPTHIVFSTEFAKSEWHDEWPPIPEGIVTFDSVPRDVMLQDFDDGYGSANSPNLCAWSPSFVVASDSYDGAEGLFWLPRNPDEHEPIRPGGG